MKSIKGSMFISISSGEQQNFETASSVLAQKAHTVSDQLNVIMPVRLIKVETISFSKPDEDRILWLATGLMKKLDTTRQ